METIKTFDEFYDKKLSAFLEDLKKENRQAGKWGLIAVLAALVLIPSLVAGLTGKAGAWSVPLMLGVVALLIWSTVKYKSINDGYLDHFKEQIVKQVIDFVHPGLTYKPDLAMSSVNYRYSSLYRGYYDDYDGEDMIEGVYKNVSFKCSELTVSRRGARNTPDTIFHGLFFAAPLNAGFTGGTYVWMKDDIQLPASIAEEARMLNMPEVVKVDCRDGVFEKRYVVYSTNPSEAVQLISPTMMQCITDFRTKLNRDITVSFVAGVCYVAIPLESALMEPQSGDPSDKETIRNYFFTVIMILGIINRLQLYRLV